MTEQKKLRNESLQKMVEDAVQGMHDNYIHEINLGHKYEAINDKKYLDCLTALRDEVARLERGSIDCDAVRVVIRRLEQTWEPIGEGYDWNQLLKLLGIEENPNNDQ